MKARITLATHAALGFLCCTAGSALTSSAAQAVLPDPSAQEPPSPRVLFLTHSAGYVHGVVKRSSQGELSHAERNLVEAAQDRLRVDCTQDPGAITAKNLANYAALVFYTTGELPISDGDKQALMDWITQGGAFIGVHCATDTFYEYAPYQEMLGGVFDGHPWHEEVEMIVADPHHPATRHLGERWSLTDEIYQFRGFRRHPTRTLLHLSGAKADLDRGKRSDGDYANAWCRNWGQGRVFYTALGHRPEVWQNELFREHLIGGIEWAIRGPDYSPPAPAGAIALMADEDLGAWCHEQNGDPEWTMDRGIVSVKPGSGNLFTRRRFGDGLYHIEFSPSEHGPSVRGQARGNSGVYLLGQYELQVLDSFGLQPGLGDCGACYGVALPLVAPYRPAGRWSSYDIEFRGPRFDDKGQKTSSARITAWLNGRLIHDDIKVSSPTAGSWRAGEFPMAPLMLQDHGNPVRFRGAWVLPRVTAPESR
jgi:uncharacterized protein